MNKEFLPFRQLTDHLDEVVVVDAHHAQAPTLSHWRGAQQFPDLHDDTSTDIVLNALKAGHPVIQRPYVTNNHFDVDGFLGVWSLFEPDLALAHEPALRQAATIGDFREYRPDSLGADLGLKLVCWLNAEERSQFYRPFAQKEEVETCVPKYAYFLPRMAEFLAQPDDFAEHWRPEYERVITDWQRMWRSGSLVEIIRPLRMLVVRTPEPLHYYALFGPSRDCDMVLTMYHQQRYELEYKYTTWVDTETRLSFPRIDWQPLVEQLNEREREPATWTGDRIMDTGPMLRLGGDALSKAERYDQPYRREILPSSWSPGQLLGTVKAFYQRAYRRVKPRKRWTWQEMRQPVGPEKTLR
jgi:hypothetical protein